MKKLIVKNFGPIEEVELNLKRVNVLIGPQSAGKSCLLKIACFCAWLEKRIELDQDEEDKLNEDFFNENLIGFHQLDGYVRPGSLIHYESPFIEFTYQFGEEQPYFKWRSQKWKYRRPRISYIPADRNLVSSIPNWFEVSFGNTNLRNFITDWNNARELYHKGSELPILDLGVEYYYDEGTKRDMIRLPHDEQALNLRNASSGIQSVIPMWVYLDFLFQKQYALELNSSVKTEGEKDLILHMIYDFRYRKGTFRAKKRGYDLVSAKINKQSFTFENDVMAKECNELFESFAYTQSSDIYLEEPEQNLFPYTQAELVRNLLQQINNRGDNLFIATHSPYVLYELNNCMLGYLVRNKISNDRIDLLENRKSWINPKEVAVWELKDGKLSSTVDAKLMTIQDAQGLVRGNYFDRIMHNVMAAFTNYSMYL